MTDAGSYLMVLAVQAFPLGGERFEVEAAFASHLMLLKASLGAVAHRLTIAGPLMSPATRERAGALAILDGEKDGIYFRPLFPEQLGRLAYWMFLPLTMARIYREVQTSDIVHAGNSHLTRPFEYPALLMAKALGKKTISVTDIDERKSAEMNLRSGKWSKKSYFLARTLYDPWLHLQQALGVRAFSLVMLKGKKLAEDYGQGRPNVKRILNPAFSLGHIISESRLVEKQAKLRTRSGPIVVTYFGRLVEYKGVMDMLQAVRAAVDAGANVEFRIIGDGPERERLEEATKARGLGGVVSFLGPIPFGCELFESLYASHILLAAPQSEDTPRSALDALAAGMSIVAYDTYYYEELAAMGAPVQVVPWLDVAALGRALAALATDPERLAEQASAGVTFAQGNTQEEWLSRRIAWTQALAVPAGKARMTAV